MKKIIMLVLFCSSILLSQILPQSSNFTYGIITKPDSLIKLYTQNIIPATATKKSLQTIIMQNENGQRLELDFTDTLKVVTNMPLSESAKKFMEWLQKYYNFRIMELKDGYDYYKDAYDRLTKLNADYMERIREVTEAVIDKIK